MKKLFLLLFLCAASIAYGQQKAGVSGVIILEHIDTSVRTPFGEYIFLARTVQLNGLQPVSPQSFWSVYTSLGEHYTYFITKNAQIAEAFAAKKKDEVIILEGAPLKPLNWWGKAHFRTLDKQIRKRYPMDANRAMNLISFAHVHNYSMFVPQLMRYEDPPFAASSMTTSPPASAGKKRYVLP